MRNILSQNKAFLTPKVDYTDFHSKSEYSQYLLHYAISQKIKESPETVIEIALKNLPKLRNTITGSIGTKYLDVWENAINLGEDELIKLCLTPGDYGSDLRQIAPFSGVLSQYERIRILRNAIEKQ